jgi:hypothetical protein
MHDLKNGRRPKKGRVLKIKIKIIIILKTKLL